VVNRLNRDFKAFEDEAIPWVQEAKTLSNRKDQEELIQRCLFPSIAFAMLDGKDYAKNIWRMLRPKGAEVFRTDMDA